MKQAVLLLLLGSRLALAQPADQALVRQQEAVEAAAAAVSRARADGARRKDVATLMAVYRAEAEALAALAPPAAEAEEHAARRDAVAALAAATADGRTDLAARATLDAWLGPLEPRLALLDGALAAAAAVRTPALARDMLADVQAQALAVMVAAAHDATASEAEARSHRLRAATLQAAAGPEHGTGMAAEVDVHTLLAAAEQAEARAAEAWALRERAATLRDAAHLALDGETP